MTKQAHIHYFTGTGNTAFVSHRLAERLTEAGYEVRVQSIEEAPTASGAATNDTTPPDLLVVGFPVYAFAVPQVVRRFINALPRSTGTPAAALCCVGGNEGGASREAARLLRRRGYDVVLTQIVTHVSNFTQAASPPPPSQYEGISALAARRVDEIAQDLLTGRRTLRRCGAIVWLLSFLVGWSFKLLGRRTLGKCFAADSRCNGCALCQRRCPVGAIRMLGQRPRWRLNCQACQRCINLCPQNAIQSSLVRVAAAVGLLFVPYNRLLHAAWPGLPVGTLGAPAQWAIVIVVWMIGYLLAALVADKLLLALEHVPGLRPILAWGLTRRYRRYLEPQFRKELQ